MIELREYVDPAGRKPFRRWFDDLDAHAAARVSKALSRLAVGNTSNVRVLTGGLSELKVDFGPGYRVYFGREGDVAVVLLAGGDKKRQQRDIAEAKDRWLEYKRRRT